MTLISLSKAKIDPNKMKMLLVLGLILLGLHDAAAVTHSLHYFYTASSGVKGFPEFVVVGMVDGEQIIHYDSDVKKAIPKQDWMMKIEDPEYWEGQTQIYIDEEQWFKADIDILKQRFNQTGGVHVLQRMVGCEWDDETGKVNGFHEDGYDGEDFIALDLKTKTWIALKQQGLSTKHEWDRNKAYTAGRIQYLTHECPDWLKKYVNYGRSSLLRTELPSVRILQKASSSTMRCHATGFYPNRAELFWRKDGEEIHEGVDKGEILPNHDGSFQMSSDLKLSSSEDRTRYECVFQLTDVREDLITKPEKLSDGFPVGAVIGGVLVLLVLGIGVVGVLCWKKCDGSEKAKFSPASSTCSESDILSQAPSTYSVESDGSSTRLPKKIMI